MRSRRFPLTMTAWRPEVGGKLTQPYSMPATRWRGDTRHKSDPFAFNIAEALTLAHSEPNCPSSEPASSQSP
jgi:hypothetical protein